MASVSSRAHFLSVRQLLADTRIFTPPMRLEIRFTLNTRRVRLLLWLTLLPAFGPHPVSWHTLLIAEEFYGSVTLLARGMPIIIFLAGALGALLAVVAFSLVGTVVARRLGDETPFLNGRGELGVTSHISALSVFSFLITGFAWGKPFSFACRLSRRLAITFSAAAAALGVGALFLLCTPLVPEPIIHVFAAIARGALGVGGGVCAASTGPTFR